MKQKNNLLFILLAFVAALALPHPARAAAPNITGVNPTSALNTVETLVTISGTNLQDNFTVQLVSSGGGVTPLHFQSWSTESIVAIVPAGLSAGSYTLRVIDPADTANPASFDFSISAPLPTATPTPFGRPQIVMGSFRTNVGEISYGKDFNLVVRLRNAGTARAVNIQAVFSAADLVPVQTGGVAAVASIEADGGVDVAQKMRLREQPYGKTSIPVKLSVAYYDDKGTPYNEEFSFDLPLVIVNYVYYSPTPTSVKHSQLVITAYQTDIEPLEPGSQFSLGITIQNTGNASAKGITMIVGGGSASGSGGGTPQPGGVSGGSGEFTNFAPVGTSNLQALGDLAAGASLSASQKLIVNVSTNPGAYPMKISLAYTGENGVAITDEQVITLLVYSLPKVDVSFYQPMTSLLAGQPNLLPLQVVSVSKRGNVLGNITIQSDNGTIENGLGLIGSLDPGGYYTLDATVYPESAGTLTLTITIDYSDDFNAARSIVKTISLDVMEAPQEELPPDPSIPPAGEVEMNGGEETVWQTIWRAILGLLGLDSGQEQPPQNIPPLEEPLPLPPGAGPKG